MYKFIVKNDANSRIDQYLSVKIKELTRSNINKLIDTNKITVNDKAVKPSYHVKNNDTIKVNFNISKPLSSKPHKKIPIIYEDDQVIVIDKPIGMLSHSKGAFNDEITVETYIKPLLIDKDYDRAGIVHRLDRATSGLMIVAKDRGTYKFLQKQFSTRKVNKAYLAVVSGHFSLKDAIINLPIARNPKNPSKFKVNSKGKEAITNYHVISENKEFSFLKLMPKTGRTHQLRVHMNFLKHSIVGDSYYNGKASDRLYLHASELDIKLPDGVVHKFLSPTPGEFEHIMNYN